MRLRNVKNAREIVENSKYVLKIDDVIKSKGMVREHIFKNMNPVHLEIGMGKGNFIIDMAKRFPEVNFIGVERYESVVCRAIEKLELEELDNVKIICIDALGLANLFEADIDVIYLNFSDPWPKTRHAKRRLTSHVFLPIYDKIFSGNPTIIQKTDNVGLFESSIVSLSTYGYTIEEISLDLHSTGMPNSMTEYEKKFSDQGIKINYLKAVKK